MKRKSQGKKEWILITKHGFNEKRTAISFRLTIGQAEWLAGRHDYMDVVHVSRMPIDVDVSRLQSNKIAFTYAG